MSENKVKAFSVQSLRPHPEIRNIDNLLEYSQVSPQCPDICRIKTKISVGNFLNDTENENISIRSKSRPRATSCTLYSKTCLKRNLKGPEHFSAKARFPFNQGTLPV